jgi:hypothetical protein
MNKNKSENKSIKNKCIKRIFDSDLRSDAKLRRNHKYVLLRSMRSFRTIIESNNNVIGTPIIAYIIQIIRPISIFINQKIDQTFPILFT